MNKDLVNGLSDLKFAELVNDSSSIAEIARKLGFAHNPGKNSKNKIKERIKNLGLEIDKKKMKKEFSDRIEESENFSNFKDIGNVGSAKFILDCIEFGLTISQPFGDNSPYDFILDINGQLKKIQVKTTSVFKNGVSIFKTVKSYRINNKNIYKRYLKEEVDYFYLYSIPLKESYFISFEDTLHGKSNKTASESIYVRKEFKINSPLIRESEKILFQKVIKELLN